MADENKTERVQLLMTPSEVKAIDDWSFENRIRGRAEAMRRLCQIGLGLEGSLQKIFEEYDEIGLRLPILFSLLRERGEEQDLKDWNSAFLELANIVEKMFSHREALAELRHTAGFMKNVDWDLAPKFSEALETIKEFRAENRAKAKLELAEQPATEQDQKE